MTRHVIFGRLLLLSALSMGSACAQSAPAPAVPLPGLGSGNGYRLVSPLVEPTQSPGVVLLMELEGRFAADVERLGGKAFALWLAEDAVTLQNGKPAVQGRGAIAAGATWDPKVYSLLWTPQGARMSAENDMGFTWGHYTGRASDAQGNAVVTSGRYMTVWKKLTDGTWKVELDASSDDAPESGTCCTLPKP